MSGQDVVTYNMIVGGRPTELVTLADYQHLQRRLEITENTLAALSEIIEKLHTIMASVE